MGNRPQFKTTQEAKEYINGLYETARKARKERLAKKENNETPIEKPISTEDLSNALFGDKR